jgi:hypothetical protein
MIRIGKITVFVKGQELKPELMTEPEVSAILECVHDLFRCYGSKIYFEGSLSDEDELLLHCFEETPNGRDSYWIPFPSVWTTKTVAMSNGKEFKLIGDKIPVTPRQLGLSPWDFVELKVTNYDDE